MNATPREDLPPALAARPWDEKRKVPIPWMNMRPEDPADPESPWIVDWTAVYGPTVYRCGTERLCGLCGGPLGYWVAFLGGPQSAATRSYVDPGFHEDCALAALRLCPHIAVPQHQRAPEHRLADDVHVPDGFDESKATEWVMGITRDFKLDLHRGIFRPAPFKRVRQYAYVDGVLTEQAER